MNETIGSRIAKYRKAQGMTQEELASKLGVSSQAVSKWENDISCPDISLLPQICRILGVTSDGLLTGKTNEVKMLPENQRKKLEELTLRIIVNSADGDKLRVNLPMPIVKIGLELGVDISATMGGVEAMKNIDLGQVIDLAEQGVIGRLVEFETSDGDTAEVVVE